MNFLRNYNYNFQRNCPYEMNLIRCYQLHKYSKLRIFIGLCYKYSLSICDIPYRLLQVCNSRRTLCKFSPNKCQEFFFKFAETPSIIFPSDLRFFYPPTTFRTSYLVSCSSNFVWNFPPKNSPRLGLFFLFFFFFKFLPLRLLNSSTSSMPLRFHCSILFSQLNFEDPLSSIF